MAFWKPLGLALLATAKSRWEMVLDELIVGAVTSRATNYASRRLVGDVDAPTGKAKLASYRTLSKIAGDGCVLEGASANAGAKYALPKGLPEDGERRLAIENEPHEIDTTPVLVIEEGYGAGTKTLVSAENAVVKVDGETFVSRATVHFHEANVAGPHWDLVVEKLAPGTPEFELHLPRGPNKGRYAFHQTGNGIVVNRMLDRSVLYEKPSMRLKAPEFLREIEQDARNWIMERKYDGSCTNVHVHKDRAYMRSHRESAQPYTDKLPALEFLRNRSKLWSCRRWFPGPALDGTDFQVELVHEDGSPRVSGLLNSLPDNARALQKQLGPVQAYVWDIKAYQGQDVTSLPYEQRRALCEDAVRDIRLFNKNWHVAEKFDTGMAGFFYEYAVARDRRGLPYSEGVVLKHRTEDQWFKVKATDTMDLEVAAILPGEPGSKFEDSLGRMVVRNPENGALGEVGSFRLTHGQRQWVWDNRDYLIGQVAEIEALELTERGVPRAGVFSRWHPSKSDAGLLLYVETLEGNDIEKGVELKYKFINGHG